ncbi:MAG: DUF6036 family nucleotidyltransferase [Candidatus Diapherotrites archaeon]
MSSEIGKQKLFELLEELDKELNRKIRVVAVGGTAMTLLGLKNSTIDIDLDVSGKDRETIAKAIKNLASGYRIDLFSNGLVFSQQLPEDYAEKAIPVRKKFEYIELLALSPLDIIVSKIARLSERDWQDIQACIKKAKLSKEQVRKRAEKVEVVGSEEKYKNNLEKVLEELF